MGKPRERGVDFRGRGVLFGVCQRHLSLHELETLIVIVFFLWELTLAGDTLLILKLPP